MKEESFPKFRETIIKPTVKQIIDTIADPPPDLYRIITKDRWKHIIEAQIKLKLKSIEFEIESQKTTFPLTITSKKTNWFLVEINDSFVLIDTGYTSEGLVIEEALDNEGCTSANLNLILLTHAWKKEYH